MPSNTTTGPGATKVLFQRLFLYVIVGALISPVLAAVKGVLDNFTAFSTGIPVVDSILSTAVVLLLGLLMVFGIIEVIVPNAKKYIGF
jgi:hypothetical protein